jgi:hypothetical protein
VVIELPQEGEQPGMQRAQAPGQRCQQSATFPELTP